jgi:hypothetical protein
MSTGPLWRSTAGITSIADSSSAVLPADREAGDVLLRIVACHGASTPTIGVTDGTTEWIELAQIGTTNVPNVRAFYAVSSGDGDDEATVTLSASNRAMQIVVRVADGATAEASTGVTAATATPDPDELTLGGGSAKVAAFAVYAYNAANVTDWGSPPSGWAVLAHIPPITTTVGVGLVVLYRLVEAATVDPGALTLNASGNTATQTLAVVP